LVQALAATAQLLEVSERVLRHMTSTVTPQPIAAEAPIPRIGLEDIALTDHALVLAPVNVQDPGNMGTMVRTAHAVGAAAVAVIGACVDLYAPKVVRATMGSLFWLKVAREPSPQRFLAWCREQQVTVVAATTRAGRSLYELEFEPRTAIVLGSESQGLPEEFRTSGLQEISIPMPGGAESLNVAVAAGIVMYEYRRQSDLRAASRSDNGCEGAK
jgi:TrmH family RNA methyltransferase